MTTEYLQPLRIHSLAEFKANATHWNELWERSTAENPTLRAESLALWVEEFAPALPFRVTAVVDRRTRRWVAALPLLPKPSSRHLNIGALPRTTSSTLLVDASEPLQEILEVLIQALRYDTPFEWIWPENVRLQAAEWKCFGSILRAQGVPHEIRQTHETAVVALTGAFEEILLHWDREKVKEVKRLLRKLHEIGSVELNVVTSEETLKARLEQCFDIENEGWKGSRSDGLSIRRRGHERFFEQQANILAKSGHLLLFGLVVGGKWIAFQYDYAGKQTIYCHKIGYSPEYRKYSPGFVLHYLICEFLCNNHPVVTRFDYVGEFMDYQSHWNPMREPVGQIVLPACSLVGEFKFHLYKQLMPFVRYGRRRLGALTSASAS